MAGARIGHRQSKADGDRGIHRIAALPQNVGADARRNRLLRHHHAVLGDDHLGMADLLVAPRCDWQCERGDKRNRCDANDRTSMQHCADGTCGFHSIDGRTRSGGRWPSMKVLMLTMTFSPMSLRPSTVAEARCGSSTTLPARGSLTSL